MRKFFGRLKDTLNHFFKIYCGVIGVLVMIQLLIGYNPAVINLGLWTVVVCISFIVSVIIQIIALLRK